MSGPHRKVLGNETLKSVDCVKGRTRFSMLDSNADAAVLLM